MKTVSKKKEERTTEEIVKQFHEMAGRFDEFWSGLSVSEREKFKSHLAELRPPL
jgi:hypothetical protein